MDGITDSMDMSLGRLWELVISGGDGIPVELLQILKDDALKVLHSICQQIWKTQQWPQDWKRSIFIAIPKKGNAKECSNYCTVALIPHQHPHSDFPHTFLPWTLHPRKTDQALDSGLGYLSIFSFHRHLGIEAFPWP